MAKPKRSSGSGLRKNHGPKKHMHKDFKPMVHLFAKAGLLTKYNNEESFVRACEARTGRKNNNSHAEWIKFSALKTNKAKDEYFHSLKPVQAKSEN